MRTSSDSVYSMGAVVKMLGVSATTLRAWEDRYAAIVPARSVGGHRLYSRDQVDQLRFVCDQLDQGHTPGDAHRLLAERSADEVPTAQGGITLSILLAERDPYAAEIAEYFLRTEGYQAAVVLDAAAATRELAARPPNLLVVDLLISGGVGLEVCRTAKVQVGCPVLVISTLDARDEAFDAGADAFLNKPLDPLRFVSTVRDLLGTSAMLKRSVMAP